MSQRESQKSQRNTMFNQNFDKTSREEHTSIYVGKDQSIMSFQDVSKSNRDYEISKQTKAGFT